MPGAAHLQEFPYASVAAFSPDTMVADQRLLSLGIRPNSGVRVPYFSAAIAALPGTRMIAVLPRRFTDSYMDDRRFRIADAPLEVARPHTYGMSWHPRLDRDPAHCWFRSLLTSTCQEMESR